MPGLSSSSKIIIVYLSSMPVFTHCFCLSLCRFLIVQLWKEAACTFNDFSLNVPIGKEKKTLQPARTLQASVKEAFAKQHGQIISNNLSKAFFKVPFQSSPPQPWLFFLSSPPPPSACPHPGARLLCNMGGTHHPQNNLQGTTPWLSPCGGEGSLEGHCHPSIDPGITVCAEDALCRQTPLYP